MAKSDEILSDRKLVLGILIEAGEAGMLTSEIALRVPWDKTYQNRSNRISQFMRYLAWAGCVERAGFGPSPLYHHQPVSRWRAVQPQAGQFMERPTLAYRRQQAAEAVMEEQRKTAELLNRVRAQVSAYVRGHGSGPPSHMRTAMCRELRDGGATLQEIGDVFGVTRERARQIIYGVSARPCRCPECVISCCPWCGHPDPEHDYSASSALVVRCEQCPGGVCDITEHARRAVERARERARGERV